MAASVLLSTMSIFLSREGMLLLILIIAGFFLFFTDAYGWKEKWKRRRMKGAKKGKSPPRRGRRSTGRGSSPVDQ